MMQPSAREFGELEGPTSLRIVRLLPACAQLSSLVEADGQGLGNPRGRKPRERADRSAEAVRYGDLSGGIVVEGRDRACSPTGRCWRRSECTALSDAQRLWMGANQGHFPA